MRLFSLLSFLFFSFVSLLLLLLVVSQPGITTRDRRGGARTARAMRWANQRSGGARQEGQEGKRVGGRKKRERWPASKGGLMQRDTPTRFDEVGA